MPGLLRGMARTAVVAGTATAVSNRVSRRQANRWASQDEQASYQQQQQYAQAVASYREVLRLNPRFSEAHNNLGTVLKELEQHDEAIASYRHALAINPQMAESHYNIGVVPLLLEPRQVRFGNRADNLHRPTTPSRGLLAVA